MSVLYVVDEQRYVDLLASRDHHREAIWPFGGDLDDDDRAQLTTALGPESPRYDEVVLLVAEAPARDELADFLLGMCPGIVVSSPDIEAFFAARRVGRSGSRGGFGSVLMIEAGLPRDVYGEPYQVVISQDLSGGVGRLELDAAGRPMVWAPEPPDQPLADPAEWRMEPADPAIAAAAFRWLADQDQG